MGDIKPILIEARQRFIEYRCKSIQAALTGVAQDRPGGLAALVALRESLPEGFRDFADFESSRLWSRRKAIRVFDDAISRLD